MLTVEKTGYNGVYLPEYKLAMDGNHPDAEYTLISHAHSDHLPNNRRSKVWCTRPTYAFMQERGFRGEAQIVHFGETVCLNNCTVTTYPAGHILGSAMFHVESDRGTLLYTGDCRTPPSPASEGFERPIQSDILIVDATFSLPIYRWKPPDELTAELRQFAAESLEEAYTPVFLGYNLGKAQELMHMLAPLDHPMQIHGAGFKMCRIYEEEGIELGNYEPYDREKCEGKILITPSSALGKGFASNVIKKRIAYCSGWAVLESRRTRLTVDKLIPISDHLDFFELIRLCESMKPDKVYVAHASNPEVVKYYLKQKGIKAEAI